MPIEHSQAYCDLPNGLTRVNLLWSTSLPSTFQEEPFPAITCDASTTAAVNLTGNLAGFQQGMRDSMQSKLHCKQNDLRQSNRQCNKCVWGCFDLLL